MGGRTTKTKGGGNSHLQIEARLASWATPTNRDHKHAGKTTYRDRGGAVERRSPEQPSDSPWSDLEWLDCTDGKARPVKPGLFPLAHGIPGRVGRLRAYGNAIVPQVAAEFIAASVEAMNEKP